MIKKELKIVKKLPRVQIGTILNIFWTNGSYEKPSNPITREDISKNFIDEIVKIDWADSDTGLVKLQGKFNYLVYKEGEFYFLNPIRVVDIKKQIFIYSVVKDFTMTMLYSPSIELVGTLTKTINEEILFKNIDFTKPLVEDYDEIVVVPVHEEDKLFRREVIYKPINLDTMLGVKVFSSSKLAWIIRNLKGDLFDRSLYELGDHDIHSYNVNQKYTKNSITKLLFKCEFDTLLPHKEILDYINNWLQKGGIVLGSVKKKDELLKDYSCSAKFKELFARWPNVYLLSHVEPVLELEQNVYFEKFEVEEGKELPPDYFEGVNKIVPLHSTDLTPTQLDNKHIFDMLPDERFTENIRPDRYYSLLPRNYSALEKNEYRLFYNFSKDALDKIGHLNDEQDTEKEGVSILNNIPVIYSPDYWRWTGWTYDTLNNNVQESVKNNNPVLGFILYEIYDYWKYTRGTRADWWFFNMYTGDVELFTLPIVTGLKFYDEKDNNSEVDLLVEKIKEDDGDYSYIKNDNQRKINFGLVTSEACKQLINPFDVFNMFALSPYVKFSEEQAVQQSPFYYVGKFITTYKDTDTNVSVTGLGYTEINNLSRYPVNDNYYVKGVKNRALMEHCHSNYTKIRDISTCRKFYKIYPSIKKGDLFWSNVSFGFYDNWGKNLTIDKTSFAILVTTDNDLSGNLHLRFSRLIPHEISPQLDEESIIVKDDEKQVDKKSPLYPWVITEKKYFLPSYETDILNDQDKYHSERKVELERAFREFSKLMEEMCFATSRSISVAMKRKYNVAEYRERVVEEGWFTNTYETNFYSGPFSHKGFNRESCWSDGNTFLYDFPVWRFCDSPSRNISFNNFIQKMFLYIRSNEKGPSIYVTNRLINVVIEYDKYGSYGYSFQDFIVFKDDTGKIIGRGILQNFNVCRNFYAWATIYSIKLNEWIEKWHVVERKYEDRLYRLRKYSFSESSFRIVSLFAPTLETAAEFEKKVNKFGYDASFKQKSGRQLYGNLSLTLYRIYKENGNSDSISLTRKGFNAFWSDVSLEHIKKNTESTKLHIFKLIKQQGGLEIVKGYALMQYNATQDKILMQILLADKKNIINRHKKLVTPEEDRIINTDIYQCINQKNFFYVYGQKIPIKAKLMKPHFPSPFEIYVSTVSTLSDVITKFKVSIKTPVEIIETKISVPKREVHLQRGTVSYVDLEKLKIDISEREENKALNLISGKEKARLLDQKLQNAKEELAFQEYIGPWNIAGSVLSGAARTSRFFDPAKGLAYPNVAAGLLGASTITNLITGIMQHNENMRVGKRDIEQMDQSNAFTVAHEKNILDSKHKHEEMREKIKIMEMTSNYTDSNSGEDAEEIATSNKLLFDDEKAHYGFIHYRPSREGVLMKYIKDFYNRYGVDIFINNFTLPMSSIIDNDLSIWKFDSISSINIVNNVHSEKIRGIFINGVKFRRCVYAFEHPKHTFDQSYTVKKNIEERRKLDEGKLLLQARGELDSQLKDAVRIAKEDLDAANAEHQRLTKEKEELEVRIAELEPKVVEGCTAEVLTELAELKENYTQLSKTASGKAGELEACRDAAQTAEQQYQAHKKKCEDDIAGLKKVKEDAEKHAQECAKNLKKITDSNKDLLKQVDQYRKSEQEGYGILNRYRELKDALVVKRLNYIEWVIDFLRLFSRAENSLYISKNGTKYLTKLPRIISGSSNGHYMLWVSFSVDGSDYRFINYSSSVTEQSPVEDINKAYCMLLFPYMYKAEKRDYNTNYTGMLIPYSITYSGYSFTTDTARTSSSNPEKSLAYPNARHKLTDMSWSAYWVYMYIHNEGSLFNDTLAKYQSTLNASQQVWKALSDITSLLWDNSSYFRNKWGEEKYQKILHEWLTRIS